MTIAAASDRRRPSTSALRTVELGSTGLGVLLIGILHVVPPTNAMNPLTVTISQYGRTPLAGVFVAGVVLIALGSTATLILLVQSGALPGLVRARFRPRSLGRRNDGGGAVPEGRLGGRCDLRRIPASHGIRHRFPVAARGDPDAGAARGASTPHTGRVAVGSPPPRGGGVLAAMVLAAIVLLGGFIGIGEADGIAWWTRIPIGLTERLLVFTELVALALVVTGVRIVPMGATHRQPASGPLGLARDPSVGGSAPNGRAPQTRSRPGTALSGTPRCR